MRGELLRKRLLVILIVCWPTFLFAATTLEERLKAATQAYESARGSGQYARAVPFAEEMLRLCEQLYGANHTSTLDAMYNVADLYHYVGRYEPAEAYYRLAISREKGKPAPGAAFLATVEAALGDVLRLRRKYPDAETALLSAVARFETMPSPDLAGLSTAYNNLAIAYKYQRKFTDAEQAYLRALALKEKQYGTESPKLLHILGNLAANYQDQEQIERSIELLQRAFAIAEINKGIELPAVMLIHYTYGTGLESTKRLPEAIEQYKKALTIADEAFGQDSDFSKTIRSAIARVQEARLSLEQRMKTLRTREAEEIKSWGRGSEQHLTAIFTIAAEHKNRRDLIEAERQFLRGVAVARDGNNFRGAGQFLTQVGVIKASQDNYEGAEALFKEALAEYNRAGPEAVTSIASAYHSLASISRARGRLGESKNYLEQALEEIEKSPLANTIDAADVLYQIAKDLQGNYADPRAIDLVRKVLAIRESQLGPNHPQVAQALDLLTLTLKFRGRNAEALPLAQRELEIERGRSGPESLHVIHAMHNLAMIHVALSEIEKAWPLAVEAERIFKKQGVDAPGFHANLIKMLGVISMRLKRYDEAESYFLKAKATFEKIAARYSLAEIENDLGNIYHSMGQVDRAIQSYEAALQIERALEAQGERFDTSTKLNLANRYGERGRHEEALPLLREAARDISRDAIDASVGSPSLDSVSALTRYRDTFLELAGAAHKTAEGRPAESTNLAREGFEAAQWAGAGQASAAIAQMSSRFAVQNVDLGGKLRESQDLLTRRRLIDARLLLEESKPVAQRKESVIRALRSELSDVAADSARLKASIDRSVPGYRDLVHPLPISLADAQRLLSDQETLVLFTAAANESLVWIITRTDMRWLHSELGTDALNERVAALRCGLDHTAWFGQGEVTCQQLFKVDFTYTDYERHLKSGGTSGKPLPLDLVRAHELYKVLLGPAEDLIKGKHLLLVPSRPLTSLPFNVLVIEPPGNPIPTTVDGYRNAAWLGVRQPITVLPSVASLKALRERAKASHASKPYLGIGNPLLDGEQYDPELGSYWRKQAQAARDKTCGKERASLVRIASTVKKRSVGDFASLFRGQHADINKIREWSPLPETADELCEVGAKLGAVDRDFLIGASATETNLKDLSDKGQLAQYAILHFATHGALTGQVQGAAEPGLILTPPARGTTDEKALERDDGFLTASEIATLKLDADWVVLSACNTAAGSTRGQDAEALSGMARAFFYAGARTLLVSHWEVGSQAAVKLTTRAFDELKAKPTIGRAEALRISMRELIEKGTLLEAHPSQWGPFVVVGEGAAVR